MLEQINRNEFLNRQLYAVSAFRELDQNNNNSITRNEWRGTSTIFNNLDTNNNNLLSEGEFNAKQNVSFVERVFRDIFNWE